MAQLLTDSGYKPAELRRIMAQFVVEPEQYPEQNFQNALAIGLLDGDVVEFSKAGTVMLSTPREELDRRVAEVKRRVLAGASVDEAVEAAIG